MADLAQILGGMDIYLVDQLMRGRIGEGMRILDAGCGGGRNAGYFLRNGYEIEGIDREAEALGGLPAGRFRVGELEALPYEAERFDVVIVSAVLHFARDEAQFRGMVGECWRVLKRGGIFFARLTSTIGVEGIVKSLGGGRYWLPDGSERFCVDAGMIERYTREMGGELLDPIKSTVVSGERSMATWVAAKG
jgi:tellurite methyltransferase